MDLFGDDFTAAPEVDPAAEFLAREQDQLAGLDDDLLAQPEAVQPAEPQQGIDCFDNPFGKIVGCLAYIEGYKDWEAGEVGMDSLHSGCS